MSIDNWISPVRILEMNILGVNLTTDDTRATENSQYECFMKIGSSCDFLDKTNGEFLCGRSLEVSCDWASGKGAAMPALSVSCKIGITISIPEDSLGCASKDEAEAFLAANAISLAYGKARSVIESLTAESGIGRRVLPAIDPYKLLDSLMDRDGE